jgi:hypothetical protein
MSLMLICNWTVRKVEAGGCQAAKATDWVGKVQLLNISVDSTAAGSASEKAARIMAASAAVKLNPTTPRPCHGGAPQHRFEKASCGNGRTASRIGVIDHPASPRLELDQHDMRKAVVPVAPKRWY